MRPRRGRKWIPGRVRGRWPRRAAGGCRAGKPADHRDPAAAGQEARRARTRPSARHLAVEWPGHEPLVVPVFDRQGVAIRAQGHEAGDVEAEGVAPQQPSARRVPDVGDVAAVDSRRAVLSANAGDEWTGAVRVRRWKARHQTVAIEDTAHRNTRPGPPAATVRPSGAKASPLTSGGPDSRSPTARLA